MGIPKNAPHDVGRFLEEYEILLVLCGVFFGEKLEHVAPAYRALPFRGESVVLFRNRNILHRLHRRLIVAVPTLHAESF